MHDQATSASAARARAAADDTGGSGETGDTALDCGSAYSHDSADTDEDGGAVNNDHGSPENRPYDIDAFDDVESCASCHPQHYDEWQGSIHAYAATNPLMWKGSAKIYEEFPDFPAVCVGCHGPIATLTGTIPHEGAITAKDQLSEQAQDGVSCTICHKLYDVHDGVNQFTQCNDYYFATLDNPTSTTYHSNDYSDIHTYALVCRSCHNVENLVQTQVEYTYTEWQDANEAAGGTEFEPAIQTCQDCHMPAYQGQAATDGPTRTVHRHTFVGGDVALTPFPDSHRQYKAVKELMKTAGSVEVTPVYTDGIFSDVDVLVTNLIEGHELPSGSAFDREVWVEIYVTDADGNVKQAPCETDDECGPGGQCGTYFDYSKGADPSPRSARSPPRIAPSRPSPTTASRRCASAAPIFLSCADTSSPSWRRVPTRRCSRSPTTRWRWRWKLTRRRRAGWHRTSSKHSAAGRGRGGCG